jgi:hypothetical protein
MTTTRRRRIKAQLIVGALCLLISLAVAAGSIFATAYGQMQACGQPPGCVRTDGVTSMVLAG